MSAATPVSCAVFGRRPDGREVHAYTLVNTRGLSATILTLGAIVQSVRAPDRNGRFADIVLGFDTLEPYLDNRGYVGAAVGRYANRIAGGRFRLDGREHVLSRNETGNTQHGGTHGFDKAIWNATVEGARLSLSHRSPDGDQGFPGELAVAVTYELTAGGLQIAYEARTSAATVVNLTNHSYWNLAGHDAAGILDHVLQVAADRFTPVDEHSIPSGVIAAVDGTPFDFRTARSLRLAVQSRDPQVARAGGIDQNFVLDGASARAALLRDPVSGRTLELFTTEPGLQVYTGNHLEVAGAGKGGVPLRRWSGIALETQHFPDSPNQASFPSTVLRPDDTFRSSTIFRIGCDH